MTARPDIAPAKSCGDCGLCCKLIGVQALDKPQFTWCRAYRKGAGCTVYADRPDDCRAFICYWLHVPSLGKEWRPDRCGFVMHIADGGRRLNIETDPSGAQTWRREPYASTFRAWALAGRARGLTLIVWQGRRAVEITPDGEHDHGLLRPAAHTRRSSNTRLS